MEQEQRFGLSFQQWDYTVLKKGVEGLEDATNNLGFEQIFPDGNLYALLEALSYFWENNDGLRISVNAEAFPPYQTILSAAMPDAVVKSFDKRDDSYFLFVKKLSLKKFSLKGPLFAAGIAAFSDGSLALVFVTHHLAADYYALAYAEKEIKKLYETFAKGDKPDFYPSSFKSYVTKQTQYLNSRSYERDQKFWRSYLAKDFDVADLEERTDNMREGYVIYQHVLTDGEQEMFDSIIKRTGASPEHIWLSAVGRWYMERHNKKRILLLRRFANRTSKEEECIFGMCRAVLPFIIDKFEDDSSSALIESVQKESLRLLHHARIPELSLSDIYREIRQRSMESEAVSVLYIPWDITTLNDMMIDTLPFDPDGRYEVPFDIGFRNMEMLLYHQGQRLVVRIVGKEWMMKEGLSYPKLVDECLGLLQRTDIELKG